MPSQTIWQKIGLHDWFLKNESVAAAREITRLAPNDIFNLLMQTFNESVARLSFADRIVFYHEYIVCFNADDYKEFISEKKGIFGLIIHEAVKHFYATLKSHAANGKIVAPSGNKWVFRFVAHPDYGRGDKSIAGKLLPDNVQQEDNLRVTFIPRQTGMAERFDISNDILKDFTFYSEGYYEVPYDNTLVADEKTIAEAKVLAKFEAILPDKGYAGKKATYLMKDPEIIVTGKEDNRDGKGFFKVPSEWVNTPHLRIRFNNDDGKFYVTSLGEKTILNEVEMQPCTPGNLQWVALPFNSKLVLNGIVGINIFKP